MSSMASMAASFDPYAHEHVAPTSRTAGLGFNPKAYLEKFGYSDGKGLGKNEDGMKKHITVNKKEDSKGIGAHEDYTKSFETLFNQAASSNHSGGIASGITFFDTDDEADEHVRQDSDQEEEERKKEKEEKKKEKKRKKEEKKEKKEKKSKKESKKNADSESDADEDAEASRPSFKRQKLSHTEAAASPSSSSSSSTSSPRASPLPSAPIRTLPPSSIHFIKFSQGSKLLAESHTEVDMKGEMMKKQVKVDDLPQAEMQYISATKPRPAASSIPRAKENNTIKHGQAVAEINGEHLYHARSQGKMKRLEEADKAYLEKMKAMMSGSGSTAATSSSSQPQSSLKSSKPSSSPISSVSSSPSPTSMDESTTEGGETEEQRKARKAAKKQAKKEKRAREEK